MINNYFFLEVVAQELHSHFADAVIESIVSPSLGELRVQFIKQNRITELRLNWETNNFLFRIETEDTRLPKKYEKQLFDAWGKKVVSIKQAAFDRYWVFELSNGSRIIIKCFPIHGNAMLMHDKEVLSVFRRSKQKDFDFKADQLHFDKPDFAACLEMIRSHRTFSRLQEKHPLYFWENWLQHRSFVWNEQSSEVLPLAHEATTSAMEIASKAFRTILPNFLFKQKKDEALRQIEQQAKHLEAKIEMAEEGLGRLLDSVDYQTQGQLLLAHMHSIRTGSKEVLLDRWDQLDAQIRIKLDPSISVVENANRLFQKAKNQHIAREKQEEYLAHLQEQKEQLAHKKEAIQNIERLRDFKKLDFAVGKAQKSAQPWRVIRSNGFEVWIGKSAAGNDELLRRSHKDDCWLHARDVSGSHVLIRNAGRVIPQPLLEAAASWAAFYSKGKNEQLCPVSYTSRKFVRKPKGAAPGAVVIDRENVLIVPPIAPASSE